ncbi:2-hydroxy-3-oxopropionate reductase [Spirochaetia bacterium]|nr:2-hydroxy-3-oxopropionate reductase [Spirochaetia bacterium]
MGKVVGFIGLGVMGQHMARHLAQKFPGLLINDIDKSRAAALIAAGSKVEAVSSPAELAQRADIVFLSLPTTAIVRDVVSGALVSSLKKGSIVVDTSTTEVTAVKTLAAELEGKGIEFIDAPVSGGEKGAADGTLAFMIGGKQNVFESVKDYCAAMGASVVHLGPIGSGQIAKAVNQMIVGTAFAVIAESFSLGVKNGLDTKALYEAIRGGWAGSKVLDVAAADMLSREFKPGGTVDIHWKDLGIALSLSRDTDVPVPVTALVQEIFKAARAKGDGKKSQTAVVRLWETLLNQEI